ncbi:MAG: DUF1893 domain-containing protein [Bacteroides sp.]|nr:DUF1893 domain-containing protein [Bacteroides sp.]MCM1095703.1 DUF1893 domain-containing protein [Terasakiella sp.]
MSDANIISLLHDGHHSLVVANGDEIRTCDRRGIADLHSILTAEPDLLRGARVADKVVGKGAAAIMIAGGVASVYTDVISSAALTLFRGSAVSLTYSAEVPAIINRRGDGICPVEQLCAGCDTAADCLPLIDSFIKSHTP